MHIETQTTKPIPNNGSKQPKGGSNGGKHWLDFLDDAHANEDRKGNLESVEVYVHVEPMLKWINVRAICKAMFILWKWENPLHEPSITHGKLDKRKKYSLFKKFMFFPTNRLVITSVLVNFVLSKYEECIVYRGCASRLDQRVRNFSLSQAIFVFLLWNRLIGWTHQKCDIAHTPRTSVNDQYLHVVITQQWYRKKVIFWRKLLGEHRCIDKRSTGMETSFGKIIFFRVGQMKISISIYQRVAR